MVGINDLCGKDINIQILYFKEINAWHGTVKFITNYYLIEIH